MNPILPIIVRECDGIRAKVIARYGGSFFASLMDRLQQHKGNGLGGSVQQGCGVCRLP